MWNAAFAKKKGNKMKERNARKYCSFEGGVYLDQRILPLKTLTNPQAKTISTDISSFELLVKLGIIMYPNVTEVVC